MKQMRRHFYTVSRINESINSLSLSLVSPSFSFAGSYIRAVLKKNYKITGLEATCSKGWMRRQKIIRACYTSYHTCCIYNNICMSGIREIILAAAAATAATALS